LWEGIIPATPLAGLPSKSDDPGDILAIVKVINTGICARVNEIFVEIGSKKDPKNLAPRKSTGKCLVEVKIEEF